MADNFSIGKRGPTIFQGKSNPNIANHTGLNGDLYVQVGQTPTLYQFRVSNWVDVTGEVFHRTPVSTANYLALDTDFYLGLRQAPCVVQLPQGTFGKKFIIKDETGAASPTTSILIQADSGQTIDGDSSMALEVPRSSVTLVYGVEWHVI